MTDEGKNQQLFNEDRTTKTLADKVRLIQERARQWEFMSDGSSDKEMFDEAWGEEGPSSLGPLCR